MNHHGGKYSTGDGITISDFVFASFFGNYFSNTKFSGSLKLKATLENFPKIEAYYALMMNECPGFENRIEQSSSVIILKE